MDRRWVIDTTLAIRIPSPTTHLLSVRNACMLPFSRGQTAAAFNVLRWAGSKIVTMLLLLQMVAIMIVLLLLLMVVEIVHFLDMVDDQTLPQLKAVALA